jgi:putative transposase
MSWRRGASRSPRCSPTTGQHTAATRERVEFDPGETCPDCGGALRLLGEDISEMLELAGVSRRRPTRTTIRDERVRPASDRAGARNFYAEAPNQLWVADITYLPTWAGFLYLAVVLDAFSRRIVGWAMGTDLRVLLVLNALNTALGQRRPAAVIHHSDQGSQHTSVAFGLRCKEAGLRPSMGSVGDAYDNAMCESFFATLECELLQRRKFATKAEARMAVFTFVEGWYNPSRRHSAPGYRSPADFERTSIAGLSSGSP